MYFSPQNKNFLLSKGVHRCFYCHCSNFTARTNTKPLIRLRLSDNIANSLSKNFCESLAKLVDVTAKKIVQDRAGCIWLVF